MVCTHIICVRPRHSRGAGGIPAPRRAFERHNDDAIDYSRHPAPGPQTGIAHRTFGASGLEAPVLCFGTAGFGGGNPFFKVWGDVQQGLANRLVDIAIHGGVNFDTANIYGAVHVRY